MFDSWLPESKDHLPITWWKGRPVYLAAIVALAAAASMVMFGILGAIVGAQALAAWFAFDFASLREWRLWTPLSYVLVNPPSLWTLIGCLLMWNFGEAVERHFGRRAYVRLLLLLVLAAPAMITLLHLAGVRGLAAMGVGSLGFGMFVAFATLYPQAKINLLIATVDAWVLAAVFVGINVLQALAFQNWSSLLLLMSNVGTAYVFVRFEKGELKLPVIPRPSFNTPAAQPRTGSARVARTPARPAKPKQPSVDDILDKISHQGMHSLTLEERRILDEASEEMKRRAR